MFSYHLTWAQVIAKVFWYNCRSTWNSDTEWGFIKTQFLHATGVIFFLIFK